MAFWLADDGKYAERKFNYKWKRIYRDYSLVCDLGGMLLDTCPQLTSDPWLHPFWTFLSICALLTGHGDLEPASEGLLHCGLSFYSWKTLIGRGRILIIPFARFTGILFFKVRPPKGKNSQSVETISSEGNVARGPRECEWTGGVWE